MAKFKKGQSGNKSGRPKGIKDKRVRLRELFEPHAQELIEKAVTLALGGDTTALRLCLDRCIPPLRARDEAVSMPVPTGTLTQQGAAILAAMANGDVTPQQAGELLAALASQVKLREADELEPRIRAIEERLAVTAGGSR